MSDAGFETAAVNEETVFVRGGRYVRIICGERYASVELAESLYNAERNMYEDIDIYDYEHMKENGFPDDDDIFVEICADINKYIISH